MFALRRFSHQPSYRRVLSCNLSAHYKYGRNAFLQNIHVKTFTDEEIDKSFDNLKSSEGTIHSSDIIKVVLKGTHNEMSTDDVKAVTAKLLEDLDAEDTGEISRESFATGLRQMAGRFDSRVKPLVGCYLVTGATIGIIVPCMPLLVSELGITSTQFGCIVASFGLAKLLGNIPSSHYVDIIGRKPLFFSGMGLASVGIGGIGLSLNPAFGFPWIIFCRTVTGAGVSAIMAGGNMMVADISTFLNRAQTQAPLQSAWMLGMIAGPGLGGVMIDSFGLASTYYCVGGGMLLISAASQLIVQETKPHVFGKQTRSKVATKEAMDVVADTAHKPQHEEPRRLSNSLQTAVSSWRRLTATNQELRHVVLLNGSYWAVMSGVQLTMLPLLMVDPVLDMTATQIGFTFISLSLVALATAQPLAYLADNYNKHAMFVTGSVLLGGASLLVPYASTPEQLALSMIPFAVGSTIMQNVPTAHVVNICASSDAPQAMSLLRTVGDLGLIAGATGSGILAAYSSVGAVIQGQGSILLATLTFIGYQKYISSSSTV